MHIKQVHDGNIISVTVLNDELTLTIVMGDSTKIVSVPSLQKLRVNNFQEGNIVNSVLVYKGYSCADNEEKVRANLAYLYDINNKSIERKPALVPFLDQQFQKLVNGELVMIEVEPSYGCYLVALGKGVTEEDQE